MKIIIVEDEENIRNELTCFLNNYGYDVSCITKFDNIVEDIISLDGQLLLLDVNLPMYDGYYVCRELRKDSDIPIIIVTSRDSELDELMSMNLGADDFISKPYNTQILLARIASLLKRTYKTIAEKNIEINGVSLNMSNGVITYNGMSAELSKNEYKILQLLMNKEGSIISRSEIMNMLWQSDEFIDENTLTVNVNRLRHKLAEIGIDDFVKTKRGQGYYI